MMFVMRRCGVLLFRCWNGVRGCEAGLQLPDFKALLLLQSPSQEIAASQQNRRKQIQTPYGWGSMLKSESNRMVLLATRAFSKSL